MGQFISPPSLFQCAPPVLLDTGLKSEAFISRFLSPVDLSPLSESTILDLEWEVSFCFNWFGLSFAVVCLFVFLCFPLGCHPDPPHPNVTVFEF